MNFALPSALSVLMIRDILSSQNHDIGTVFVFIIALDFSMNIFYAHFCTISESSQQELWVWISSSSRLVFKPVWHLVRMRSGMYEI